MTELLLDFVMVNKIYLFTLLLVIIGVIIFLTVGAEFSNTGKLLIKKYPTPFITVNPPVDIVNYFKPKGEIKSSDSRTISVYGNNVEVSYDIMDYNEIMDIYLKHIDILDFVEFALPKIFKIIFSGNKLEEADVVKKIIIRFVSLDYQPNGGLQGNLNKSRTKRFIRINVNFLKEQYDNLTEIGFFSYCLGLLAHELTHTIQYVGDETGVYYSEPFAEYVRLMMGFSDPNWDLLPEQGDWPRDSYGPGSAYFIFWLNKKFDNYVYKLHRHHIDMRGVKGLTVDELDAFIKTITSSSLDDLWQEFQQELPGPKYNTSIDDMPDPISNS